MLEDTLHNFSALDWIEQCFTSTPTQYRLYGRRFFSNLVLGKGL